MTEKHRSFKEIVKSFSNNHAAVIENPYSGHPLSWEALHRGTQHAAELLRHVGFNVVHELVTTGRGDAAKQAEDAIKKGAGLILIRGGDGTASEALPGLMEHMQSENSVYVGLLGGGRKNVFTDAIHTPSGLVNATNAILLGERRHVDVGNIITDSGHEILFLANAGIDGWDARGFVATEEQSEKTGKKKGYVTFAKEILLDRHRRRKDQRTVQVSTDTIVEPIMLKDPPILAVVNGGLYGEFRLVDELVDDGILNFVALRGEDDKLLRLAQVIPHAVLRGKIPSLPPVPHLTRLEGRKIKIEGENLSTIQADGNGHRTPSTTSVEISVHAGVLNLAVPSQEGKNHTIFAA